MDLAFLYKQFVLNGPEINGLEAGMTSSAFTLTSQNYYCLLFPPSNKGTQSSWWVHIPIPITKSHHAFNVNASLKGPQPWWTRKRESKQMLICRTRGTNCSLVWTWVCSWARHHEDSVWQEAMVRPSVEARRPERVHSLHMGEQFPPKWLLTNGRPNYRQDWWVCPECWIYLSAFFLLWKKIFAHKN